MKRNLSSQAIRAMAIGMAVTLGSATAVSGVVTGTVVNVYAADFNTVQFTAKATKSGNDLKITITRDGSNVFKAADNNKKLTGLIVKNGNKTVFSDEENGQLAQVTSDAKSNANELVITIPNAQIKAESLDGTETSLTITKLKSTDISYGASSQEQALDFTAGSLNVTTDNPIGIDKTAPIIESAVVEKATPDKVKVTFSENVKGDSLTAADFKVLVGAKGDQNNVVTNIEGIGTSANTRIATLTLTKPVTDADTVKLYYQKSGNSIKDAADNEFANIAEGSKIDVTNELKDIIAPTIQSGVIENDKPNEVILTFSENINVVANQPDATDFKVLTGTNSNIDTNVVTKLSNIDGSGKTLTLTLKDNITSTDVVKVYYTKGNNVIQDAANNHFLSIDRQDAIEVKNNIKPPVSNELTATTDIGTYKFKELNDTTVALTEFTAVVSRNAKNNIFENGILKANGKTYTLTEIGDGTKAVGGLTTVALEGHTTNVTEIKEKAFENNTDVTTLSFPKVTTVGANAFKGANALTTIDLGSQADKTTIDSNAFSGATAILNVTTNKASEKDVEAAAKKGNSNVKVEVSISKDKYNSKDAKIEKDKFYKTEDGLLFKGLNDKDLTFMGKNEFKAPSAEYSLDGSTEANAYFVTYENGTVKLQSEKSEQLPAEDVFTVEASGNTLTFKKLTDNNGSNGTVALTSVAKTSSRAASEGKLSDGVLTVGGKKYDLTELGDGTNSLGNFADDVLTGNLEKVTTVKAKAFDGNTAITTITLPAIITIEANAFTGTSKLTTIDLGNNDVNIAKDAFKDAGNSLTIKTNSDKTRENITNSGSNATVENPAPEVFYGVVTKEASNYVLTLTLSENVFATQNPDLTDFVVKSGTNLGTLQNNAVKSINIENNSGSATNTVKLTLTNAVNKGDTVTVAYTQTKTEDKKIKDTASRDAKALETFADSKITVFNNVEDSPVQITTVNITGAKVNKNTVTLTTKENNLGNTTIDKGSEPNVKGFVFKKGGSNQVNITKVVVANNTITLTLESPISESDSNLTFEYTGGSDDFKVGGKKIDNIASKEVINETNDVPTISSGTANKAQKLITLTASEDLNVMSNANNDFGFTVKNASNSSALNVAKVEVKNQAKNKIEITVSDDLTSIDTLKVTYTKPSNEANQIKDSKGALLENIEDGSAIDVNATRAIALRNDDFAVIALAVDTVEVVKEEGTITGITSVKGATQEQINSILTKNLTTISSGAFKDASKNLTLDFSKVNVSNLTIASDAFSGASLKITGVSDSDAKELAKKIGSSSDIKINDKTTSDIIKEDSNSGNGGSGSGGGSSSVGSGGGSGANIGTITNKEPNTEETTSQGNNNNETVVEDKQLSFDVIKLPSVEGEAKVFGDVSANHWAKSYIDKLSTAGIINGSNGMFNPNGQTKRADVTIMLVNLLGLTPEANNKFADVNASAYYAPYVGTASTYGIVNGSNGMFNPQGVISRQDTMVMIAQILKGLNLNVNADATALSQFGDASKVSAYANESVAILVNSGIIAGNNGKLNPTAPVTRAEMATIMSKLYDVLASANK